MKRFLSVLLVLLSGLVGLSLVFTDWVPVPLGTGRVAIGAAFYLVVGFLVARWNAGGRPLGWSLATAWGLALLGIVGLWVTLTDPASGDWTLAALFLAGPLACAGAGGWLAKALG